MGEALYRTWSWTSTFKSCEINFCCLSHPCYGILLSQPELMNLSGIIPLNGGVLKWKLGHWKLFSKDKTNFKILNNFIFILAASDIIWSKLTFLLHSFAIIFIMKHTWISRTKYAAIAGLLLWHLMPGGTRSAVGRYRRVRCEWVPQRDFIVSEFIPQSSLFLSKQYRWSKELTQILKYILSTRQKCEILGITYNLLVLSLLHKQILQKLFHQKYKGAKTF